MRFNLEVLIRSDFADLFEVKSGDIVRRGHITTEWSQPRRQLRSVYRNKDFRREVVTQVRRNSHAPVYANGRLSFDIELEPGASWHACLLYSFMRRRATLRRAQRLHRDPRPLQARAPGRRLA